MNKYTQVDNTLTSVVDPRCYTVNTRCSEALIAAIHEVQDAFMEKFGDDVFCPRGAELHATLLNWLDPFIEYEQDKVQLFQHVRDSWESITRAVLEGFGPVKVRFDTLEYRGNTICLEGFDDGTFAAMRAALASKNFLPAANTRPPTDIHVTILTFRRALDEQAVLEILGQQRCKMEEVVDRFRLVYSPKARLQDHVQIGEFELGNF